MAKLIYSAVTSLDGYIEDEDGGFDWGAPDEEVFECINDLERPIGTHLYGRRMFETMVFWEHAPVADGTCEADFARIWRAADKVVYSKTLATVSSARTAIERKFDAGAVRRMKTASTADLTVSGADLAGQALRAGLVDECHFFVCPLTVGGGKPALPRQARLNLELLNERRFGRGVVHLHYGVRSDGRPS